MRDSETMIQKADRLEAENSAIRARILRIERKLRVILDSADLHQLLPDAIDAIRRG